MAYSEQSSLTDSIAYLRCIQSGLKLSQFQAVSEDNVLRVIDGLACKSTSGWDEIPISVIKLVGPIICKPLTHVINLILKTGIFPSKLKFAVVIPVYKRGDAKQLSNYRPIALLPALCKIVEKIVFKQVVDYFEGNNLLSKEQFGFRRNKSAGLAINNLITSVVEALDGSRRALGLFCDLSKAFDSVNHVILLNKLKHYGLGDAVLEFFNSYLSDRWQQVKVWADSGHSSFSDWEQVLCGVPQGSILGPLLFILYINDLPASTNCKLVLFADDTTVIAEGKNPNDAEKTLRKGFEEISRWFECNELMLNVDKTHLIRFSAGGSSTPGTGVQLPGGGSLDSVQRASFLGVQMQSNVKWNCSVDDLQRRLSKAIFAIGMVRKTSDTSTALKVYHSYFVSLVRYSIIFWGSYSTLIEKVFIAQKQAIRAVFKLKFRESCKPSFKYHRILTVPSLYIMEVLMLMKKNMSLFDIHKRRHTYNTRRREDFNFPAHRLSLLEKSPFYAGLGFFNKLPLTLKEEPNVQAFRSQVEKHLLDSCVYSVQDFHW